MASPVLLWTVRLAVKGGRLPSELLGVPVPGELNLVAALALVDGPWWGAREDILAARQLNATAGAAGVQLSAGQCLPSWHRANTGPVMLSFADGVALLAQRLGGE